MPAAGNVASDSLWISCGVVLIAVFLGLRQFYERRSRENDLSEVDRIYFGRQDRRRYGGVAILLAIAAGLSIGSRMPTRVQGHASAAFVEVWAGVVALLVILMTLALIDLVATRGYARRKRRLIAEERTRMIRDAARQRLVPPTENDQNSPAQPD
jgi:hypothetical protein